MWAFAASGERLTSRLRVGLFSSLLHQEPSFHDMPGHSVGALTGWLSDDAAKVQAVRAGDTPERTLNLLATLCGSVKRNMAFLYPSAAGKLHTVLVVTFAP